MRTVDALPFGVNLRPHDSRRHTCHLHQSADLAEGPYRVWDNDAAGTTDPCDMRSEGSCMPQEGPPLYIMVKEWSLSRHLPGTVGAALGGRHQEDRGAIECGGSQRQRWRNLRSGVLLVRQG